MIPPKVSNSFDKYLQNKKEKLDGMDMKQRWVEYNLQERESKDKNHATSSYIEQKYIGAKAFKDLYTNNKSKPSSLEEAYRRNYKVIEDKADYQKKYSNSKTEKSKGYPKRVEFDGSETRVKEDDIYVPYVEYKHSSGKYISTAGNNCVNGTCNTLDLPVKGEASVYNPSLRDNLLKGDYYVDKGGIDNVRAGSVFQTMVMKDSRGLLFGKGDAKKEVPGHARAVVDKNGDYISIYDNHGSKWSERGDYYINKTMRDEHANGVKGPSGPESIRTDALIYNPLKARLQKLNKLQGLNKK